MLKTKASSITWGSIWNSLNHWWIKQPWPSCRPAIDSSSGPSRLGRKRVAPLKRLTAVRVNEIKNYKILNKSRLRPGGSVKKSWEHRSEPCVNLANGWYSNGLRESCGLRGMLECKWSSADIICGKKWASLFDRLWSKVLTVQQFTIRYPLFLLNSGPKILLLAVLSNK